MTATVATSRARAAHRCATAAGLAGALVLVLASCSDGSDAAAGTTAADTPTTTTPATTSLPPTPATTTVSVSPTSPTPPSTTIETTVAPTTAPPPTLEDEIRAAYQDIYDGYWACLRAPLACDTSWLLDGSPSAIAMSDTMQGLADRDRYVGDDDVGYYVIREITIDPNGESATVISCWWSTAVLYGAPIDPDREPGPDNPATIVNNTPGSGEQSDGLTLLDGKWLLAASQLLDAGSAEDTCA